MSVEQKALLATLDEDLAEARRQILMGWSEDLDVDGSVETARHLMNALLHVELAIIATERERTANAELPFEGQVPS